MRTLDLFGRRRIETSVDRITEENVIDVLQSAWQTQSLNKQEIEYLIAYERGEQPILNRVKKVRPEINNKVVENHASEIVTFYRGYVFRLSHCVYSACDPRQRGKCY